MTIFDRLFLQRREATPGVPSSTAEQPQKVEGANYEANVRRPSHPNAALTISAVYRAIELRAKTVGQFQMQYQKLSREGGNFVPDMWGDGKRLNYLLQVQPNPIMSASQMFQQLIVSKLQLGNGFVYIERDEFGKPAALWLATCGGYNQQENTYNLTYAGTRGLVNIPSAPAQDVIHIVNTFRDINGYMGISTLRYALDTLSLIATQKAQSLETAAKGGRMKAFIGEQPPSAGYSPISQGLFDPEQMKNYAKEINKEIYNQDIVSLRGLDKVVPISMSAADQQMVQMLGMSLDDVARFYGTPRPLLMMDSNSHYTTPTNATMEYMTRTIQPDVEEIEQEFTRKLLNVYDFGVRKFHMCELPLLRLDREAQAKVDKMNLETGAKTVNEIRAQYDMPAVENGDEPMASANLMTLKALIAKSDASTQLKPGIYTVGEGEEGVSEEK